MLPKKGKILPAGVENDVSELQYAVAISTALRDQLGNTHQAVKIVMAWTGASEKTVKNWLSGTSGPRGEHLIGLVRHSEPVLGVFLWLAGQKRVLTESKLIDVRRKLEELLVIIHSLTEEKRI